MGVMGLDVATISIPPFQNYQQALPDLSGATARDLNDKMVLIVA